MPSTWRWPWTPPASATTSPPNFAVGSDLATLGAFAGPAAPYLMWQDVINNYGMVGRASRYEASQVPAIVKARNAICGTIGTLGFHSTDENGAVVPNPLLEQPERLHGIVSSVTYTHLCEDLLFDSVALLQVLERNAQGYPSAVLRVPYGRWSFNPITLASIQVDGRELAPQDSILFLSPNPPLLVTAGAAIKRALLLDAIVNMFLNEVEPASYLQPTGGQDPDTDQIVDILTAWRTARQSRSTV